MSREIEHPLREPAAELASNPANCPDCGRVMVMCWTATPKCLTCSERIKFEYALIEKFNEIFGSHIYGERVGMLDDRARYAEIFGSPEIAKEIFDHIEFYKPISVIKNISKSVIILDDKR